MRFTSLIVELIRARPRLMFWVVVLVQATLWLIVPVLFYGAPPGAILVRFLADLASGKAQRGTSPEKTKKLSRPDS